MSQLFTKHRVEKCEICGVKVAELRDNSYICPGCGFQTDNF